MRASSVLKHPQVGRAGIAQGLGHRHQRQIEIQGCEAITQVFIRNMRVVLPDERPQRWWAVAQNDPIDLMRHCRHYLGQQDGILVTDPAQTRLLRHAPQALQLAPGDR